MLAPPIDPTPPPSPFATPPATPRSNGVESATVGWRKTQATSVSYILSPRAKKGLEAAFVSQANSTIDDGSKKLSEQSQIIANDKIVNPSRLAEEECYSNHNFAPDARPIPETDIDEIGVPVPICSSDGSVTNCELKTRSPRSGTTAETDSVDARLRRLEVEHEHVKMNGAIAEAKAQEFAKSLQYAEHVAFRNAEVAAMATAELKAQQFENGAKLAELAALRQSEAASERIAALEARAEEAEQMQATLTKAAEARAHEAEQRCTTAEVQAGMRVEEAWRLSEALKLAAIAERDAKQEALQRARQAEAKREAERQARRKAEQHYGRLQAQVDEHSRRRETQSSWAWAPKCFQPGMLPTCLDPGSTEVVQKVGPPAPLVESGPVLTDGGYHTSHLGGSADVARSGPVLTEGGYHTSFLLGESAIVTPRSPNGEIWNPIDFTDVENVNHEISHLEEQLEELKAQARKRGRRP